MYDWFCHLRSLEMVPDIDSKIIKTKTHPHGYFVANLELQLGFLRISKNASTYFTAKYSLNNWLPFDRSATMANGFYCCLRNPKQRMISSILETLLRVTPELNYYSGDVLISKEIYEDILNIKTNNLDSMVKDFLAIIETHSFFDAHHEPQAYFIYETTDFEPTINPRLFALENMKYVTNQIDELLQNNFVGDNLPRLNTSQVLSNSREVDSSLASYRNSYLNEISNSYSRIDLEYFRKSNDCNFFHAYKVWPDIHPLARLLGLKPNCGSEVIYSVQLVQSLLKFVYKRIKNSPAIHDEIDKFMSRKEFNLDFDLYKLLAQLDQEKGLKSIELKKLDILSAG